MSNPTQDYTTFEQAYAFFNKALFNDELPGAMITLQRKKGAYGYFHAKRFESRYDESVVDEIALNPDNFFRRNDRSILSTLAHEMAHVWQAHFGKPGRGGYHNKQWAAKMLEIGLHPASFDKPGTMTGQKVSHDIMPDGLYSKAVDEFLGEDVKLLYQSSELVKATQSKSSKNKFVCPECDQAAWAKETAQLACGLCMVPMEMV